MHCILLCLIGHGMYVQVKVSWDKETCYCQSLFSCFHNYSQNLLLDAQSNWLHYDNVKCTGIEKRLSDCTGTLLLVNHADVQNMEQVFVLCNESEG